jgi:large subunit ribosomal protein L22
MQAIARVKYLKVSPKKMRLVADLVKDKPVEDALNILNFTPRMAAHHLAKIVKAAASNAIASVGTAKLKAEDLRVTKIMVDSAPTAKRVRFQSMGRVYRLRKRYCHLMVEVEGEPEPDKPKTRTKKKVADDKPKVTEKKTTKKPIGKKKTVTKADNKKPAKAKADKIDKPKETAKELKPETLKSADSDKKTTEEK